MPTNYDPRSKKFTSSPRNFRGLQAKNAGKDNSGFEATVDYLRKNPGQAARIFSDALGFTPPFMRPKPTADDLKNEVAFAAASLVPVPGLGQMAKGVKAASKAAKAAGAVGKTSRSVAADAAKAASRRTAAETATIRKGTQTSRTAAKAVELEKQAAKSTSSKSVNTATASPVAPRAAGAEGPKVSDAAIDKFIKGRKFKNKAQAKADLEEQLRIGARMRAEGRAPGSDVPYADGSLPLGNAPAAVVKKPSAKVVKPTTQEQRAKAFEKGLKRPTNPGEFASATAKAKYQKELAAYNKRIETMNKRTKLTDEGYLKADGGAPKGATAKSIARNAAKKKGTEGPKKPAAKPAASVVKSGAEGPKGGALVRSTPSTRTPQVIKGEVVKGGRNQREPIDLKTRPINRPGSPRAIGSGRPRTADARERLAITGKSAEGPKKGGKKFLAGLGILGGVGAAGLLAKQFDSDKSPTQAVNPVEGPKQSSPRRPATPATNKPNTLLDNRGRKISRKEFERRAEFRKSLGIEPRKPGESRDAYNKRVDAAKAKNKAAVKAENERRAKYRSGAGKKKFGAAATTKTRRSGATVEKLDQTARQNMR